MGQMGEWLVVKSPDPTRAVLPYMMLSARPSLNTTKANGRAMCPQRNAGAIGNIVIGIAGSAAFCPAQGIICRIRFYFT